MGLSEDLCTEFFEDAADFPGQKSLDELLADYLRMHTTAFAAPAAELGDSGLYRFRKGAELHANSPEIVRRLHAHVKSPTPKNIPPSKNSPSGRELFSFAICWTLFPVRRSPWKKWNPLHRCSSVSARRPCRSAL